MSTYNFYEDRILELILETGGSFYDVIYAHHQNGGFCCIPNWKIGCEAGEPSDTFYNTERLEGAGIKGKDAKVIALAIKAAYDAHKDKVTKSCRNCEHYRLICDECTIPSFDVISISENLRALVNVHAYARAFMISRASLDRSTLPMQWAKSSQECADYRAKNGR